MSLFYPTILRKRVTSITAEDLRALGVRGLLLDVDNTLTTHGSQALDPAVLACCHPLFGDVNQKKCGKRNNLSQTCKHKLAETVFNSICYS